MTDKAMAEYLLRIYAEYTALSKAARKKNDDFAYAYYDAKADLAFMILQEKFGMEISETENEYIAYIAKSSVKVEKRRRDNA